MVRTELGRKSGYPHIGGAGGLYFRTVSKALTVLTTRELPATVRRSQAFQEDFKDEGLDDDVDDFEKEDPFGTDDSVLDDDDEEDGDDELSGLEVEELKMVQEGISEKALTSAQAMEVAGFRRQELSINPDDHAIRQNEFLCESCFLVKRITQRAAPRNICNDCC